MTVPEFGREPEAEPVGWPILVAQAGRHGNREVMLPMDLDGDLLRSVLGGLVTSYEEPSAVRSVPVAADNGAVFTVVSRRTRATSDSTARSWDIRSRRPAAELAGHRGIISAVSVSRDGQIAATAGWDRTLRTWDTRTGEQIGLVGAEHRFSGCCLDPAGRTVTATGFDGTVSLSDVRIGDVLMQAKLPVALPGPIAIDVGAAAVLAGAQDGTIRRVRRNGEELEPFVGHEGPVTALALSADGRLLASGGRDGRVLVRRLESPDEPDRLAGHAPGVTACVFLDDARLLTGGWDGIVRLWDFAARKTTTVWQDASAIRALAVMGAEVAISSQSGVITAVDPAGDGDPVIMAAFGGHVDALAGAAEAPVLITGSTNDVPDGEPVRDGFGRRATFTEGLIVPGEVFTGKVTPSVWHRVHAESLAAMGVASDDPSGRTIVAAPTLTLG